MLRLPLKITLILGGFVAFLLAAHGLYVHFSLWEAVFSVMFAPEIWSKLFLSLPVGPLGDVVLWMSIKGFQSWIIPASFIPLGALLWWLASKIHTPWYPVKRLLHRLRLW